MMDTSPNLALPYLAAAQAQKHVTHNEAIRRLDALVHLAVLDRDQTSPPANPENGARHIVAANATGGWTGKEKAIAAYQDGAWVYLTPQKGWLCWVEDEEKLLVWTADNWSDQVGQGAPVNPAPLVGINTTADTDNRLAVRSANTLFSHDGADHRFKINKAASGDTASLLFQNNWSGRAEFGLIGSDTFQIKTSPDGTSWVSSFTLTPSTAIVNASMTIGQGAPVAPLTINRPSPNIVLRDTAGNGNNHAGVISWRDGTGAEKVWCGLGSSGSTQFLFLSHYAGGLQFYTYGGDYPIEFSQGSGTKIKCHTNGYVGILQAAPTAPLHVNGAIRTGSCTVATMPSASAMGAGALIYVSDASGGPVHATSNGTTWLKTGTQTPVI